ncbi:HNH endonuclease signature motif containing protein [Microbacterium elymi]|uniref:HNH endonuclease n=1 Tax=Microbacterium elymi TaxID=2909587 RepID=A0ABY5NGM4_9MICO|nr:HNH endonuclease signature motif containing protein [Microbacterium elymi]UUT34308.1 HNH endonuclease [Microbacterium elymi]
MRILDGRSDSPALLTGHGPIDLATAKRLAASASGWDRVLTDPCTGEPLAVDRYRPSAAQQRFLDARDEHCRFPGCTQPTWRCDLDHTVDHARGGKTCAGNLAHFCRRHHILKHHSPWRVEQLGRGRLRWTRPTGRVYLDRPTSTVQFVPDPPPF